MKKAPKRVALILAVGIISASCSTTSERFHWGTYEQALYIYAKKPDQGLVYEKALVSAIDVGRKTNRVAPGLLAELGYMYLERGDASLAIPLFEEEMSLFPESRAFLNNVVARAKSGTTQKSGTIQ